MSDGSIAEETFKKKGGHGGVACLRENDRVLNQKDWERRRSECGKAERRAARRKSQESDTKKASL